MSSGNLKETSGKGDISMRGNSYAAACPTRLLLDQIADKWTVLVLGLLARQPMRFNELRRNIDGISQKMLSQTLRRLEANGFVLRTVYPTVPVSVEYSITDLGVSLSKPLDALRDWAEVNFTAVKGNVC